MHFGDISVLGWWMMVVLPLLWLGVPALIIWIVLSANRSRHVPASPLDVLKRRYAEGHITHEQFEQMKRDLE